MVKQFLHAFGRTLVSIFLSVENPPQIKDMQCIIAANHNSHIDIMILFRLFDISRVNSVKTIAAKDYFGTGLTGYIARILFNSVLVDRGVSARKTFEILKKKLEEGYSMIIFPEGTRGQPGIMDEFKAGIGQIGIAFPNIPIYPVYLSGAEKSLPKGATILVPFCIGMKVLDPVYGRDYLSFNRKEGRRMITAEIESRIRSQIRR